MMLRIVQSARQPAAARKRLSIVSPCSVCMTSGWKCMPYRPSGALWPHDLAGRYRGRDDFRVDLALPDAPGDELGVLGPEVHHENRASDVGVVHRVSLLGSRSRSTLAELAAAPTR